MLINSRPAMRTGPEVPQKASSLPVPPPPPPRPVINFTTRCPPGCRAVQALAQFGLVSGSVRSGSVRTRRAPPPLIALCSVVLEPDRGRNIALHVVPLVATLSWSSLDLVSSAGRCAHVAPRPRCSRCAPSCSNPTAAGTLHRALSLWLPRCPGPRSTWSRSRVGAHTSRPLPLLTLRSVVLEPDRGRNIASHVVPLVVTLSWPSLDLVSSAGRCAHVAPRASAPQVCDCAWTPEREPPPVFSFHSV